MTFEPSHFAHNAALGAFETRHYHFLGHTTGTALLRTEGMDWQSPSAAVDWKLFTEPSNLAGSTLVSCTATFSAVENRYVAACPVPVANGQTYYVAATESLGTPYPPLDSSIMNLRFE